MFQLAFAVLVGKLQKVEGVFVFDSKLRLIANVLWKRGVEVRLIEQRFLVGFVFNLVDQNVLGPSELLSPLKIELALGRVLAPLQYHQIRKRPVRLSITHKLNSQEEPEFYVCEPR